MILNEQNILKSSNYNISISVFPRDSQPSYLYDPYFKIYDSYNEKSAENVARISILRHEYVYHRNDDGKGVFILKKKDIAFMLKCLRDTIHGYDSAWDYMCDFITKLAKDKKVNVDYRGIPIPDYTKLKY